MVKEGIKMRTQLRAPGGTLGLLSLVATYVLAIVGGAGFLFMLADLVFDLDVWAETSSDKAAALVLFFLVLVGAVGFAIMGRAPWLGAILGVVGGLALAAVMFWTIVTIALGIGAAVVAVWRAWALTHRSSSTTPHAATG